MSLQVGDIPMTDALKGLENFVPAYDPQKKVFQQAFLWLDSACDAGGRILWAEVKSERLLRSPSE